ncbi:MAG: hypothetical protein ACUVX9_16090 [Anaerolineae bacterium]
MRRRPPPGPPEIVTAGDALRILYGLLMIPLGGIILYRTLSIAVTPMGLMAGSAFIAFGLHRLWLGWSRYRLLRQGREKTP